MVSDLVLPSCNAKSVRSTQIFKGAEFEHEQSYLLSYLIIVSWPQCHQCVARSSDHLHIWSSKPSGDFENDVIGTFVLAIK